MNKRFHRTELMVGAENLRKLQHSRVTVVGVGATGSYALEALVRMGIGKFTIVDFDVVQESNFNRQLLATEPNLNKKKIQAAKERILSINPRCQVEAKDCFFAEETAAEIFSTPTDILVDAIDGLNPKTLLLKEATLRGLPIVSCMGAARKYNPFLLRSGDISETMVCPLARRIRKRLKKLDIFKGIRCIYSLEKPTAMETEEVKEQEEAEYTRGRPRPPMPSLPYLTGMVGLLAAHEVCTYLLNGKFSTPVPKNKRK